MDLKRKGLETMKHWITGFVLLGVMTLMTSGCASTGKYHVSPNGNDSNSGSAWSPFKTISTAAAVAQPGDVITVHEGTYRERIDPPRGGASDTERIVYRAAKGDKPVIKGSEVINSWQPVSGDTWKAVIPNTFFGNFNPYSDLINGDWFNNKGRDHHTGAVYLNGHWLSEAAKLEDVQRPAGKTPLWFGQVDKTNTTIWAQFKGVNPNDQLTEINVRQSVFYPARPGINYITVRGFTMEHAAAPWAPPTAEQVGLIGTHWSKGWIIEDNDIRYSTCVGVTLGKYGDQWDNTSQNTATGYVDTINRALENGWSKDRIGSHIVRNNLIRHCEQAGIVGSLGAIFSEISGNTIHDIHVRRLFAGAEMSGIKIHASIDMLIRNNHIYRCEKGIWLDWMAQGTRVSSNLLHDNLSTDLFIEVNHGPFVLDNNIFLSKSTMWDWSQGGCYSHNLMAGKITRKPQGRRTPYHKPHSTEVAGLRDITTGDDRFINNIFVAGSGLADYKNAALEVLIDGNIYLNGAKPYPDEKNRVKLPSFNPDIKLVEKEGAVYLHMTCPAVRSDWMRQLVTTELLGKAAVPQAAFENYDGTPLSIDTDYFGNKRDTKNPSAGPFEDSGQGNVILKVWPAK